VEEFGHAPVTYDEWQIAYRQALHSAVRSAASVSFWKWRRRTIGPTAAELLRRNG
jgi:hypothetical protein